MLGYNMYAYCNNNPVMYVDPTGEFLISGAAVCGILYGLGVALVGTDAVVGVSIIIAEGITQTIDFVEDVIAAVEIVSAVANTEKEPEKSITESKDVKEVGDNDELPQQGNVTSVPDVPSVEAGKQGKHVPGHKNYNPDKSSWNKGENGVRQTQEAWKNSKPHPKKPNTRVGVSSDGRTIEIKFGKKGIHGYPIFP